MRATMEQRFLRSLARARPGDPTTLEGFRDRERQENSTDPQAQQLDATFELADRVLDNDADLSRLRTMIDAILVEHDVASSRSGE